ncbi:MULTISPECIES: hypothetical protein [Pseudomonas]|uniref:Glutamate 5-kinase n=1 Tax=Pseudomonas putida S13.1.2 TaxID=1384061 RepID=A0AAU8RU32_PSEPU|nr:MULTISPECIES: hypothetical protein [Pseudomonas]AJQ46434.1 hypothetical protein N805_04030 [Pseudomonas putida S13.1.2]
MPIKSTMQSSFGRLFDTAFAEAVRDFTGTYPGEGVWDPVEEVTTAQPVTYDGRGVLSRYKKDQVDGVNILATDVRLIALVNEVTDKPAPEHIVSAPDLITGQAKQYRVMEAVTDPVGVHYQIQLRAT